jgi:transcriptional regulator with XRE-family HTH domain
VNPEDAEHVGKRFGRNLVRARGRTDLSQEELGFAASLHRTEIGLLERGERVPRIDTLVKLAAALGVPASDLLDGLAWEPGTFRPGGFASEEGGRPSAED